MKRTIAFFLLLALSLALESCDSHASLPYENGTETVTKPVLTTGEEPAAWDPTKQPYISAKAQTSEEIEARRNEIMAMGEDAWQTVLERIPTSYIPVSVYTPPDAIYTYLHTAPVSATLYQNGVPLELSIDDARVVRLWNFYNNMVYHREIAISQGEASSFYEKKIKEAAMRLELTFHVPENARDEASFDKVVIIGDTFFCLRTDKPYLDICDYTVYTRRPLMYCDLNFLAIFWFE